MSFAGPLYPLLSAVTSSAEVQKSNVPDGDCDADVEREPDAEMDTVAVKDAELDVDSEPLELSEGVTE
jgi:hypothetical protein